MKLRTRSECWRKLRSWSGRRAKGAFWLIKKLMRGRSFGSLQNTVRQRWGCWKRLKNLWNQRLKVSWLKSILKHLNFLTTRLAVNKPSQMQRHLPLTKRKMKGKLARSLMRIRKTTTLVPHRSCQTTSRTTMMTSKSKEACLPLRKSKKIYLTKTELILLLALQHLP